MANGSTVQVASRCMPRSRPKSGRAPHFVAYFVDDRRAVEAFDSYGAAPRRALALQLEGSTFIAIDAGRFLLARSNRSRARVDSPERGRTASSREPMRSDIFSAIGRRASALLIITPLAATTLLGCTSAPGDASKGEHVGKSVAALG